MAKDGSLLVSDDGSNTIWRVTYTGKQNSIFRPVRVDFTEDMVLVFSEAEVVTSRVAHSSRFLA